MQKSKPSIDFPCNAFAIPITRSMITHRVKAFEREAGRIDLTVT